MASESLSFDVFWNDRLASANIVRFSEQVSNAGDDVKTLADQLDKLGAKSVTARVGLKGNKEAGAQLDQLDAKLIRLGNKVATPGISVEGKVKALADISAVDVALDKLNKKYSVKVPNKGLLSRLLAGVLGGFAGGSGTSGPGAAAAAAGSAAGGGGAAGGGTLPFAGAGLAIGGGVLGLLAGLGGIIPALASATAGLAAFGALALPTIKALITSSPAFRALKDVFASMVSALKPDVVHLFNLAVKILIGLLPQILPFANAAAKAFGVLLDGFKRFARSNEFGLFLNQMLKLTGPTITTIGVGLGQIAIAIGKLLIALVNPNSIKVLRVLLEGVALAITGLAKVITVMTPIMIGFFHGIAVAFDAVRHGFANNAHQIAVAFDVVRHAVADFGNYMGQVFRAIADIFTGGVHDAVDWHNLVDAAVKGVVDTVSKFPGQIRGFFAGAIHWLNQAGQNVIQGLWNGLETVWHKVTSFISGIASWIRAHKGPVSLDAKLLEPAGQALMGGLLRGLVGGFGDIASFIGGAASRIASALGIGGAGITALQSAAGKLLPAFGWDPRSQLPPLIALWNQESGWNPRATNPTSGAYGIPQALPADKMAAAGPDWRTNPITQILWGLGYIKQRYGSPAAAEAHELADHWYGSGLSGGVFSRPTLIGVGERGPERVDITPLNREMVVPGRGGGAGVVVLEIHAGSSPVDQFLAEIIRKYVRTRGGSVQAVFGRN